MRYGPKVRQLLMNPQNGPPGTHYTAMGEHESKEPCVANPAVTNTYRVKFLLCIEDGYIKGARYESFGDPTVMAASTWCIQQVMGKIPLEIAPHLGAREIAQALDMPWGENETKGCLTVSIAILSAINNHEAYASPPTLPS